MTNKKKSTPGGAQFPEQEHYTTSVNNAQWLAEILLDLIAEQEKPVKRPRNATVDRKLRNLIAEKNEDGEDVIINLGSGYFRAGRDDGPALREYLAKEDARAERILAKNRMIRTTWEERYGDL